MAADRPKTKKPKKPVPPKDQAFRLALGQRIRKLRESKYSQEALADEIHVIRTHMSTIELGRADVKISTLLRIAEAFDLEVEDLLKGLHAQASASVKGPQEK